MKIIVIGTNHAGTSYLRTIRQLDKKSEIVTYDRNSNISFLGCGIALWVRGEFTDPKGLFYSNPEELKGMNISVNMEHDVTEIDSKNKKIKVKDLKTGEVKEDSYDKLVFAGGTWPIIPPFEGIDLKGILLSKIFQQAEIIKQKAVDPNVKNIVVIGAGYIGMELVEAFSVRGKNVTVIDMDNRVFPKYFDPEFTDKVEEKMKSVGVNMALGEKVVKFEGENGNLTAVVTDKGTYKADIAILSIGFIPQTKILEGQVDMIKGGAIKVNNFQKTSNDDIYAIGDSCALYHNVLKDKMHVALATNAVKTGIVAALHTVAGETGGVKFPGVQGTNAIGIFGFKLSSTGFSEESCKMLNIEHKSVFIEDADRPEWMSDYRTVWFKLVFDPKTLKILGAQVGSADEHVHTEVTYMISLAIQQGLTVADLALVDYYFLPHFNKPFNFIIKASLKALGLSFKD